MNLFLVVNMFLVISIDYFIDYLHFNFLIILIDAVEPLQESQEI